MQKEFPEHMKDGQKYQSTPEYYKLVAIYGEEGFNKLVHEGLPAMIQAFHTILKDWTPKDTEKYGFPKSSIYKQYHS